MTLAACMITPPWIHEVADISCAWRKEYNAVFLAQCLTLHWRTAVTLQTRAVAMAAVC